MSMQKEKTFVLNNLIAWFMIVKYLNYWENILLHNNVFHSLCMREWFDRLINIFSFLSDLWAPVLCFLALQPQQLGRTHTYFQNTQNRWLAGGWHIFNYYYCFHFLGFQKKKKKSSTEWA